MEVRQGYKQTDLGFFPYDWNIIKVKDITNFHKQGYYTTESYKADGKYYLLRGTDMQNPRIDLSTTPQIDSNEVDYQGYKVLIGDFLLVRSGAIGRYGIVDIDTPKSIFGSYLINFRFNNKIDTNYFGYFYQSYIAGKQIKAITQGGGNLNINAENIKALLIPLPPTKSEQTAIATTLSDADALITSLEKLIEKKRAIKQGAMQELLRPKEGWVVKKLGDLCDVRDGTHDSPHYYDTGVVFITSKNIIDGKIDFTDISFISTEDAIKVNQRSRVDKGDIIMSMIGTIGNAVLIDFEPDFCIKNVALLKPKKINPVFLVQLIHSPSFQNLLESKLDGGIQKFISLGVLRGLDLEFPTAENQTRIATILSDMDVEISALEQKLVKCKLIKQGMMQELLTGKTRLI
jgi:type I restriction enzyme S subunit